MLGFLFPIALFLSAILLFSIQPMIAKALLPLYGGTPAVWTVCMLFFQLVLLGAYGYVWLLSFFKRPLLWRLVHCALVLLSLTALPLLFRPYVVQGMPEWSILSNLLSQLGLPLLVIGASAPLLQFAYSQTQNKKAADPYFLYAASNLGSLVALILYPWCIERFIGLSYQFHLWSIGYWVNIGLLLLIFFTMHYQPLNKLERTQREWSWRHIGYWTFLSFIPCSLMLGVTLYITTDVAATPLFWVLPLALYLLSFVMTFTNKPLIAHHTVARNCVFFLIFPILGFIFGINRISTVELILFNLMSFFVLALLCHGQLFQLRPKPQLLTLFYFCLAFGGVLAGIFNGIIAPNWFNQIYEYPLAMLLSLLALPLAKSNRGWWLPITILIVLFISYILTKINWFPELNLFQIAAIIALCIIAVFHQSKPSFVCSLAILLVFIFVPIQLKSTILLQERNFYGVKQVVNKEGVYALISQSTVHGLQPHDEKKPPNGSRAYYTPVHSVVAAMSGENTSLTAFIIGLGTGTTLCQFSEKDKVRIIEIDEQVIKLAKNPQLFTYVHDCLPKIQIIKNDGRLALAKIPDASQNLVLLDAFNSDAIPVHLMTLEAFGLYKQKIKEDGVILVNMSNRHLNLLPVLNAVARSLDLMLFNVNHIGDPKLGSLNSQWALLTSNQNLAFKIMQNMNWHFVADDTQFLWTDDYSNIIPLLRF